jgi:hypothetical protein
MSSEVYLVFGDGRQEPAGEFESLELAASAALRLADEAWRRNDSEAGEVPINVDAYRDGRLEISVEVMPGGLLTRRGGPRS